MVKHVLLMAALVACGGHKPADDTTPDTRMAMTTGPSESADNANMIPPEKMDEVTQNLKRKNAIVSHCLATAMEAGAVPRGTHGHISFEIKIGTEGHATDATLIKTDVQAPEVVECAKKHVMETAFPNLPKPYETSFSFAMEAN